jgi:hypothetical protein
VFHVHTANAGAVALPSIAPSLAAPASPPSFASPAVGGEEPLGGPTPRPAGPSPAPAEAGKPCVCGHGRAAHEHYRRGKDCALCSCARYRRRRLIGRRGR